MPTTVSNERKLSLTFSRHNRCHVKVIQGHVSSKPIHLVKLRLISQSLDGRLERMVASANHNSLRQDAHIVAMVTASAGSSVAMVTVCLRKTLDNKKTVGGMNGANGTDIESLIFDNDVAAVC